MSQGAKFSVFSYKSKGSNPLCIVSNPGTDEVLTGLCFYRLYCHFNQFILPLYLHLQLFAFRLLNFSYQILLTGNSFSIYFHNIITVLELIFCRLNNPSIIRLKVTDSHHQRSFCFHIYSDRNAGGCQTRIFDHMDIYIFIWYHTKQFGLHPVILYPIRFHHDGLRKTNRDSNSLTALCCSLDNFFLLRFSYRFRFTVSFTGIRFVSMRVNYGFACKIRVNRINDSR